MAEEIDSELDNEAEALMIAAAGPHFVAPWARTMEKDKKHWRDLAKAARDAK